MKLSQLAQLVGGRIHGAGDPEIRGIAQVDDVREDELTVLAEAKYLPRLLAKRPAAVLTAEPFAELSCPQVVVPNPRVAAIQIAVALAPDSGLTSGLDARAVIDPSAKIDAGATVMALAYVGAGAVIGPRTVVMPQVYVGPRARLGADCVLHPGVRVGERVVLGDRVIVHHNVSLGADGFGYFHDGAQHQKIPQKGTVVIEDDVEIGANTCVDRATFGRTVVGAGTKIDNLVQIGHNCLIGKRCVIVSQAGMAGSVVIGDDCVIAGRAAIVQHVRIGHGCLIGPSAGVKDDVPDGARVGGFIAKDMHDWGLELAGLSRLPEALKELARLRARLDKLEKESS